MSSNTPQTIFQIDKDKVIEAVAKNLNYKITDVVIGVPYVETADWVMANAGNKNYGGGIAFVFKKTGEKLELIYKGQECPSKTLIQIKQIPQLILFGISPDGCK